MISAGGHDMRPQEEKDKGIERRCESVLTGAVVTVDGTGGIHLLSDRLKKLTMASSGERPAGHSFQIIALCVIELLLHCLEICKKPIRISHNILAISNA
jgi:hypothetical protein